MKKNDSFIFCVFCICGILVCFGNASAWYDRGEIDSGYKWAWSNYMGWVNFGCENCNILVTDTAITGYAWNENYGWINMSPAGAGVVNDGLGNLSGYAWISGLGWVDFSGVKIDGETGRFKNFATGEGASFEAPGGGTGYISFDCGSTCNVVSGWRSTSFRHYLESSRGGGSNYEGTFQQEPTQDSEVINDSEPEINSELLGLSIDNGKEATNNNIVNLSFSAGSEIVKMIISNSEDFSGAVEEDFLPTKIWRLSEGDGKKTVYAKFFNSKGIVSKIIFDSIDLDTVLPELSVTYSKIYQPNETVILSGMAESGTKIYFSWQDQYGTTEIGKNGQWSVDMGQFSKGETLVEVKVMDSAGNITAKDIIVKVADEQKQEIPQITETSVEGDSQQSSNQEIAVQPAQAEESQSFLRPTFGKVFGYFGKIFKNGEALSPQIVAVFKETPKVLQGKWNLMPISAQK